jgi:hypothetical protein
MSNANDPPQGAKINIGGGLIPQPNGTFIGHIWFSDLPNEAVARNFMAQLDGLVKQMFNSPPPPADRDFIRQ